MSTPLSIASLPAEPGTYALLIRVAAPLRIQPGRLGSVTLDTGWAVYVGSALGPGGLRARVGRHLRQEKRPHWHIDALTGAAPVVAVWAAVTGERLECRWAAALRDLAGTAIPARGFGASDCQCEAHLLIVADPEAARLALARVAALATPPARLLVY